MTKKLFKVSQSARAGSGVLFLFAKNQEEVANFLSLEIVSRSPFEGRLPKAPNLPVNCQSDNGGVLYSFDGQEIFFAYGFLVKVTEVFFGEI